MAQTLGLGLTAWSPIGGGLLTGKYRRRRRVAGDGRLAPDGRRPVSEREWQVVKALEKVAGKLGRSMAQVAINWVATQPAVGSVIVGASSARPARQQPRRAGLRDPGRAAPGSTRPARRRSALPYGMFTPEYQSWIVSPGLGIGDKPEGYAPPVFNGPIN